MKRELWTGSHQMGLDGLLRSLNRSCVVSKLFNSFILLGSHLIALESYPFKAYCDDGKRIRMNHAAAHVRKR